MDQITVKEILDATKGTLLCGDVNMAITDISTNSREMGANTLFVPLIGERVDAHRFIESALCNGGAALTQEHDSMDDSHPWIRVEHTLRAMQDLGAYYRNRMHLPIVAVTGSVGKTTTREMISTALSAKYQVFRTEGNYNSQVGVPITLARLSSQDEVAVLEAGISMKGEMEVLASMIRPDMAVFTNIGVAHIENLKTQDNICLEKMELAKKLPEHGVVFLNGDDPILMKHAGEFKNRIVTYGLGETCDYRGSEIRTEGNSTRFTCTCQDQSFEVLLNVLGNHNVSNALVAIAVAAELGVDPKQAALGFTDFEGLRQKVYELGNYRMIDDTYNASPDSMKASINVLDSMQAVRRIAVLADMLELGEKAVQFHQEVGEYLAQKKIDQVCLVGELAVHIGEGIGVKNPKIKVKHFIDNAALLEYLKIELQQGDAILLKGSNGMHLKEAAAKLRALQAE